MKITFGPVPSRRLGRSLGINNIPPKVCSYACVYCQLGRTLKMQVERQAFYEPEEILQAVQQQINSVQTAGETIDYLTFVPDGEPTLDLNLGHESELLRPLGIPFIKEQGANVMLTGGMGHRAVSFFEQFGIDVATGAAGTVHQAIQAYLAGKLRGASPCTESRRHQGLR